MSRYVYPHNPTPETFLQFGWDPANETFFADVIVNSSEIPEWSVGDFFQEVLTVEALFKHIRRYVPQFIEGNYADILKMDKKEKPTLKRATAMDDFVKFLRENSAYEYPFCAWCGELKEDCPHNGEKHGA